MISTQFKKRVYGMLVLLLLTIYTCVSVSYCFYEQDSSTVVFMDVPIIIDSDEDFTTYDFPGSGTKDDPYLIENLNISTSSDKGIYIYGTTKHFIINNCYTQSGQTSIWDPAAGIWVESTAVGTAQIIGCTSNKNLDNGILIINSPQCKLVDNNLESNSGGILAIDSPRSIIKNNYINDCSTSIYVENCSDSFIYGNQYYETDRGIYVKNNKNLLISNNYCNDSTEYGIWIYESKNITAVNNQIEYCYYSGIEITESDHCLIYNNIVQNIFDVGLGINLEYSSSNQLLYNSFNETAMKAISISDSNHNEIHHNNFLNDFAIGVSQCADHGTNNLWYEVDSSEGNFWTNWVGSGSYDISGTEGSSDLYPLEEITIANELLTSLDFISWDTDISPAITDEIFMLNITLKNTGISLAYDVVVTLSIPNEVELIQGYRQESSRDMLPARESYIFSWLLKANSEGMYNFSLSVSAGNIDSFVETLSLTVEKASFGLVSIVSLFTISIACSIRKRKKKNRKSKEI